MEVRGVFAMPWIRSMKGQMRRLLRKNEVPALLFNVKEIEKMDEPGVETVLKLLRSRDKGAVLGRNLPAYFIAEHMDPREGIPIFESSREAVEYFGREFAKPTRGLPRERRRLPRVKTALLAEVELEQSDESFVFDTVVTNLSEGGLFAYFLETTAEEFVHRVLDPLDLRMLKIRIALGRNATLEVEGKVLRSGTEFYKNQGLAVAFYNVRQADQALLHEFIEAQGKHAAQKRQKK